MKSYRRMKCITCEWHSRYTNAETQLCPSCTQKYEAEAELFGALRNVGHSEQCSYEMAFFHRNCSCGEDERKRVK
jgi:hypothetical protein